jgi:RHS repeat-associated protein
VTLHAPISENAHRGYQLLPASLPRTRTLLTTRRRWRNRVSVRRRASGRVHYNYFRDLDPAVGRYVESDPIGLEGGIATYSYAESHPVLFADPFGLCAISPTNQRCLAKIFETPVDGVRVRNKKVVRNNFVTTRRNEIRLPPSFTCDQFQSYPLLMLHEYYHVLRQWNTGRLTRRAYASEWAKNGSSDGNK